MLTLYFSPGACSTASHIGIEETGAAYIEKPILLMNQEQKAESYLKINPRGKVPALQVGDRVITENTAILTYLARQFPKAQLLPTDPVLEAQCIGTMAWFSNIVHPSYQRYMRAERFAEGEAAQASVKALGKISFWSNLEEINALLAGKHWLIGEQYSVTDAYALVFYGWALRSELPIHELTHYSAWKNRMLERPAVKKILLSEKNIIVKN